MISDKNPWLVLVVVSAALFLVVVDMTVLNVALTPPDNISLAPGAWDSLDQTFIAVSGLPAGGADTVLLAGKSAFINGVSVTLCAAAAVTIVLFIVMATFTRNKRP